MNIDIIYIYHNCFIMRFSDFIFVFDIPSSGFMSENSLKKLQEHIKDRKAFVFSSHAHGDHYSYDMFDYLKENPYVEYILSDDISFNSSEKNIHFLTADKLYDFDLFNVETFKSNDEGIAFLITINGKKIYFGGDLACWKWEDLTNEEESLYVEYYYKILERLKKENVYIAFSNCDNRLSNYSGAEEFIDIVKPSFFIPMHTFGNISYLKDLNFLNKENIFIYSKTGDEFKVF